MVQWLRHQILNLKIPVRVRARLPMSEMFDRIALAMQSNPGSAELIQGEAEHLTRVALEAMREPTPEMLAATLPNTGRHHDPIAERTAKQALFLLENRRPQKYEIEMDAHHKGHGAALDLIGDWRAMIAAACA